MVLAERDEFDRRMQLLVAGFNVPPLDHRADAYFLGLAKMSLPKFASCVEYALSEDGPDKFPSVAGLWLIYRKLRTVGAPIAPSAPVHVGPDNLLFFANRMMFRHMMARGGLGSAEELHACRRVLLEIVETFARYIAQGDEMATPANFASVFLAGISRVSHVDDETRVRWQRGIKHPLAQRPFEKSMADIHPQQQAAA